MRHCLVVILMGLCTVVAQATIMVQGTDEEKAAINAAMEEIKKNSATAQAILDDLDKPETGDVVIKFGDTSDIATATSPPPTITLDKAAIAKMKQVGEGKALEQFSLPYLIIHEAWHILHPDQSEDQTVAKVNEVRGERQSSKRLKYEPDIVDRRLYLPFDDNSKVDLTDALKTGSGGTKAVDFWQSAGLSLSGTSMAEGGFELSLSGGAPQAMTLTLPPVYGGSSLIVELLNLSAMLQPSVSDDFSLSVSVFEMTFGSFDLDGQQTGLNFVSFYLDHQTPYGDWTYTGEEVAFTFDFAGDLGWSNDLFSSDFAMAYEHLTGTMWPTLEGWTGEGILTGVKFGPIPEPASLAFITAGALLLLRRRSL